MNILFLCTGNSARSLIAEAVCNRRSRTLEGLNVKAYSAGSRPAGRPNPIAIEVLENAGYETDGLRSTSWGEFSAAGSPRLDLVVTLCDSAAAEACPAWPGAPETLHWGLPDPAAVADAVAGREAFARTLDDVELRVERLLGGTRRRRGQDGDALC